MSEIRVIVHGLRELEAAFTKIVVEVDPDLSKQLRALAEPVKQQAQESARGWSAAGAGQATTAGGLTIRRRKLSVRVEQGLSKTTGKHGNYGGIQMRHFLEPSLSSHQNEIEDGIQAVINKLVDI